MDTKRTCFKLGIVLAAALFMLAVLILAIDNQIFDELKFNLSLWTIIMLVLIINIVSFVCFIFMYAAYRWIKSDTPQKISEESSES